MLKKSDVSTVLYGHRDANISLLLATRLDKFISNVTPLFDITAKEIISEFTIWPYLSHFVKSNKHEIIFDLMSCGKAGIRLANAIGLNGSDVVVHRLPKYCPLCNSENIERNGESFWLREHQIPNILICTKHNCFLEDPIVDHSLLEKYPILVPSDEICSKRHRVNTNTRFLEIAILMKGLLLKETTLNFEYRARVMDLGYFSNGFIAQERLESDFLDFYTPLTVDNFLAGSIRKKPKLRLDSLINWPRRVLNPVKHVLLENFIRNASKVSNVKIYFGLSQSPKSHTDAITIKHTRRKYNRGFRTPGRQIFRNQKSGRDYRKLGLEIVQRLTTAKLELIAKDYPARISASMLCRICQIGYSDTLLSYVKKYLASKMETIEEFQIRRLRRSVMKIRREGRKLTESNILAHASIWKPSRAVLQKVRQMIKHQFDNNIVE
jgi:hypothetical protein